MAKGEKAIHLQAFRLFLEYGGTITADFLAEFGKRFGKSVRTAYRWEKDFGWSDRAKQPVEAAVENLEAAGILNAEELLSGFLDLCRSRMSDVSDRVEYIKAVYATAFLRIPSPENPTPENPLTVDSIKDMVDLAKAQNVLAKEEIAWMRLVLALVGKPEQIMEDRMIVQLVGIDEDVFTDAERAIADLATEIPATDKDSKAKT